MLKKYKLLGTSALFLLVSSTITIGILYALNILGLSALIISVSACSGILMGLMVVTAGFLINKSLEKSNKILEENSRSPEESYSDLCKLFTREGQVAANLNKESVLIPHNQDSDITSKLHEALHQRLTKKEATNLDNQTKINKESGAIPHNQDSDNTKTPHEALRQYFAKKEQEAANLDNQIKINKEPVAILHNQVVNNIKTPHEALHQEQEAANLDNQIKINKEPVVIPHNQDSDNTKKPHEALYQYFAKQEQEVAKLNKESVVTPQNQDFSSKRKKRKQVLVKQIRGFIRREESENLENLFKKTKAKNLKKILEMSNFDTNNEVRDPLLHEAVLKGNIDILELFHKYIPNLNWNTENIEEQTILHLVLDNSDVEMAKFLQKNSSLYKINPFIEYDSIESEYDDIESDDVESVSVKIGDSSSKSGLDTESEEREGKKLKVLQIFEEIKKSEIGRIEKEREIGREIERESENETSIERERERERERGQRRYVIEAIKIKKEREARIQKEREARIQNQFKCCNISRTQRRI